MDYKRFLDPARIEWWKLRYRRTSDQHLRFLSYNLPPLETSAGPNAQVALRQVVEEKKLEPMTMREYQRYTIEHFKQ